MTEEIRCQFCGMPLKSWDEKHTIEDCRQYLKQHGLKPFEWAEVRTRKLRAAAVEAIEELERKNV